VDPVDVTGDSLRDPEQDGAPPTDRSLYAAKSSSGSSGKQLWRSSGTLNYAIRDTPQSVATSDGIVAKLNSTRPGRKKCSLFRY
jgi:hypothetical protein